MKLKLPWPIAAIVYRYALRVQDSRWRVFGRMGGKTMLTLACVCQEELQRYVNQMYKRREILNFVEKDFPQYTWSVRTLDRRLRYFEIYYSDKDVDIDLTHKS